MREDIFTPEHRTRILPLRILANNVFHPISMWFFNIGLKANDKIDYDFSEATTLDFLKEKIGFKGYIFLNHPYDWWGTVYKMDLSALDLDMSGEAWDDYDNMGIPYWDYDWHEDPITGDAWRLKPNAEKLHEILNTESPWENNDTTN